MHPYWLINNFHLRYFGIENSWMTIFVDLSVRARCGVLSANTHTPSPPLVVLCSIHPWGKRPKITYIKLSVCNLFRLFPVTHALHKPQHSSVRQEQHDKRNALKLFVHTQWNIVIQPTIFSTKPVTACSTLYIHSLSICTCSLAQCEMPRNAQTHTHVCAATRLQIAFYSSRFFSPQFICNNNHPVRYSAWTFCANNNNNE